MICQMQKGNNCTCTSGVRVRSDSKASDSLFHPSRSHLPLAAPRAGRSSSASAATRPLVRPFPLLLPSFPFWLHHTLSSWRTCATRPIAHAPEEESVCCQSSSFWAAAPNSALARLRKCQEALVAPAVSHHDDIDTACATVRAEFGALGMY